MPRLIDSYITGNAAPPYGCRGAIWGCQTFTPPITFTITSVKLLLWKLLSPGTFTVSIRATSSSLPTGADLCSGTTDGNTLPTGTPFEWREITFGAGVKLTGGVQYAIVGRALTGDTLNRVNWEIDESSATYAGGDETFSEDSGASWTAEEGIDLMFEVWGVTHFLSALGAGD
jgi:hypothetical protein